MNQLGLGRAVAILQRDFDPRRLETGLGPRELQSDRYTTRKAGTIDEQHLHAFLTAARADVFVPCAQRYVLTPDIVHTLANDTFAQTASNARFIGITEYGAGLDWVPRQAT
ncbi:hypothetical protein E4U48_007830 [Claviceps purpurea]|nr:hypothetical protein E4U48_007830 [Claviceps purpurea]